MKHSTSQRFSFLICKVKVIITTCKLLNLPVPQCLQLKCAQEQYLPLSQANCFKKWRIQSQVLLSHAYNPSYLGGSWFEASPNSSWDTHLQNNQSKMDWRHSLSGRTDLQAWNPKFKPQSCTHAHNKLNIHPFHSSVVPFPFPHLPLISPQTVSQMHSRPIILITNHCCLKFRFHKRAE
jgi:hypothetical protein